MSTGTQTASSGELIQQGKGQAGPRRLLAFLIRPSLVTALLYLVFIVAFSIYRQYDALHYVHIGTVFSQHVAHGSAGYDGQFFYYMVTDPQHAPAHIDDPSYRYQRIIYPLLTALLSLGQKALVPYAMLLINFISIVGSVEIAAYLLKRRQLSPWYSLALGLYFGQTTAFIFDTTEPLTYFLICLGLLSLEWKRTRTAALCMSLAVLARETAVLFPLGYIALLFWRRRWWESIRFALISLLPTVLWYGLIVVIFGRTGLGYAPPFERIPFRGLFVFYQDHNRFPPLIILMLIPTVLSIIAFARAALLRRWGNCTWHTWLIWGLNLALTIFMSIASYEELVSAGRLSTGLVLAMLLYGWQARDRFTLWVSQIYTITFVLYIAGLFILHFPS
ncbi:hypothetical protein KSD_30970 [Ktedonobacter sp. SOSP1-85]|uniref:AZOBR_p60025 family cell surface glycopolymer formation protein n=1 Tax=Ktedonobacter sp. SOSP1-85 TaxID=2778367 RepID=UPI0019164791|nr:hypothetical protein [Ktedonobacter sp. SOSP1-85]GHO75326.1 hypothetical protein KSD_30970 [Ktedonobacter sp. SOSP1-85]